MNKNYYLRNQKKILHSNAEDMNNSTFEHLIADTVHREAHDAKVILYGSRARGDNRSDSDWDVLILLNKDNINESDHERIAFPLYDLGIDNDVLVSPKLYTFNDWNKRSFTLFYKNVEKDGRVLL